MGDDKKPHPLALGGSRPKQPTGRGRPPKNGERYSNGRLKPVAPNARVIEARVALGVTDPLKPCTPLRLAFERGWLTDEEYGSGRAYAGVYSRAQLQSPGAVIASDASSQSRVEDVPNVRFTEMSFKVIAQIWDSAMQDVMSYEGPEHAQERAEVAMRRWKQMSGALTIAQRREVDAICLREVWPQWMLERAAGRFDTPWEKARRHLVSGLHAMLERTKSPTPANDDSRAVPASAPANDHAPTGRKRTDRTIYVDTEGEKLLEVVRISRDPAA